MATEGAMLPPQPKEILFRMEEASLNWKKKRKMMDKRNPPRELRSLRWEYFLAGSGCMEIGCVKTDYHSKSRQLGHTSCLKSVLNGLKFTSAVVLKSKLA
jgi:hypothetical protein